MFYTYVLYSIKSKRLYIGFTEDLKQRIKDHNNGKGGYYSKRNYPFKLIFYEAFSAKEDAQKQEKFYKTGYGREVLKEKINNSIIVTMRD